MTSCSLSPMEPVLAVKTSKAWVLPPRPKPGRKPAAKERKRKPKDGEAASLPKKLERAAVAPAAAAKHTEAGSTISQAPVPVKAAVEPRRQPKIVLGTIDQQLAEVGRHVKDIEAENTQLKDRLLALIHDYKHLRVAVLSQNNSPLPGTEDTTARKRLYTELDPMNELISNMNELTHSGSTPGWEALELPAERDEHEPQFLLEEAPVDASALFDFIKLEDAEDDGLVGGCNHGIDHLDVEDDDEAEDDIHGLPGLLRTPLPLETDCESSLMTLLTRLTTVLTQNLLMMLFHADKKLYNTALKDQPYQFYLLPPFGVGTDGFSFDPAVGPLEKLSRALKEDQYNMVTDFLEEQLVDNNIDYYAPAQDY